ncbi:single-stranded DNA-binding protein [Myceligenerans indicum]|uniref:Single-stranded DNA-binding protein n=1 Tax=Myceligenerans indicum TaxID=2593663 RepID=A0ABS1LLF5_9MICO|nr:single-stranded DNA-binding protein [Myceligenerans indicum]MBL0887082.1 single-stranded DNA-binding protein [Myceligenerans indicum]
MSNDVKVTVTGNAGSDPVIRRSARGNEWTTFPVASTRRIRGTDGVFHDGPTVWFQVKAWGHAAVNISRSVKKGQPVMVAGRLEVDEWGDEARRRTTLVINADCVGPNLMKGQAEFQRVIPAEEPPGAPGDEPAPAAAWQSGLGRGMPGADSWATPAGTGYAGGAAAHGPGGAATGRSRPAGEAAGGPPGDGMPDDVGSEELVRGEFVPEEFVPGDALPAAPGTPTG